MDPRLIRPASLPWERGLTGWQWFSGMTEEDMIHYHACLHRIRIITASEDLATSVRRHAEELFTILFTITEEVGWKGPPVRYGQRKRAGIYRRVRPFSGP